MEHYDQWSGSCQLALRLVNDIQSFDGIDRERLLLILSSPGKRRRRLSGGNQNQGHDGCQQFMHRTSTHNSLHHFWVSQQSEGVAKKQQKYEYVVFLLQKFAFFVAESIISLILLFFYHSTQYQVGRILWITIRSLD